MHNYLDFEKPIAELEGKIEELRHLSGDGEVNIGEEVGRLQGKVEKLLAAAQALDFRNNVGDWVPAGPDHPIRVALDPDSEAPRPYILVRSGLEALFVRSVFYEMVDLAVERQQGGRLELGVWSRGAFFSLGELP